jgi:hypothetical protein
LESITIPDSVTSIGERAFNNCTSLTDVNFTGSKCQWDKITIASSGNDPLTTATINYATGDHNYGEWVVTDPTCTTGGVAQRTCIGCGKIEKETLSALGHDYATEFTVDVEATCFAEGSKSRHCSRCDATTDVTVIPKLSATGDHTYGNWTLGNAPACGVEGSQSRTCSTCGEVETMVIPALSHNISAEWTIDAETTCKAEGSKSHHCLICNEKFDVTVIEK